MAYDESEMRTWQKRIVTPVEIQGVKQYHWNTGAEENPVEPRMTKQQTRLSPVPTNLNKSTSIMLGPSSLMHGQPKRGKQSYQPWLG